MYYCRVNVSEGLNTELSTSELMLGEYNKEVYQKYRYRHCVIEIKKAFKEKEDTCNMCLKLLKNEDKDKLVALKAKFWYSQDVNKNPI